MDLTTLKELEEIILTGQIEDLPDCSAVVRFVGETMLNRTVDDRHALALGRVANFIDAIAPF